MPVQSVGYCWVAEIVFILRREGSIKYEHVSSTGELDSDAIFLKFNLFLFSSRLVLKCFKALFLESEELHHILF